MCDRCGWVVELPAEAGPNKFLRCPGWTVSTQLGPPVHWHHLWLDRSFEDLVDDALWHACDWQPQRCSLKTTITHWRRRKPVPATLALRWRDGTSSLPAWCCNHGVGLSSFEASFKCNSKTNSFLTASSFRACNDKSITFARMARSGMVFALHERLCFWAGKECPKTPVYDNLELAAQSFHMTPRDEGSDRAVRFFRHLDADCDGYVSLEDMEAHPTQCLHADCILRCMGNDSLQANSEAFTLLHDLWVHRRSQNPASYDAFIRILSCLNFSWGYDPVFGPPFRCGPLASWFGGCPPQDIELVHGPASSWFSFSK